ncbi:MAG: hypothetical protein JWO52_7171 [Gammaproteobacteria bacterium]|nr:hypothetical protein [Gammaproteobacteria bacterium]
MINGVHHISLATADMARCLHFYRDLVGLTLIGEGHSEPGCRARQPYDRLGGRGT